MSKTKVAKVRDIKTELTGQMLKDMQDKFLPYGVEIEQVNVMNVLLPKDLRHTLGDTTRHDVKLQEQIKR